MDTTRILLFASDMDGTLLREDFTISPRNVMAIRKLQELGIVFVIATGRTYYDAVSICGKHSIKPYIISNNGTAVFDPEGKLIRDKRMDASVVRELVEYLEQEELAFGLGESGRFVVDREWESIFDRETEGLRKGGQEIPEEKVVFVKRETRGQNGYYVTEDMLEYLRREPVVYSISLMTYDAGKLEKVKKKLKAYGNLFLSISGTHNAEIMYQDGTKGRALEFLCNCLKIPMAYVAAAGDSMNDLEMLQKAGIGIAMGNAHQSLKEASDFVTYTNKEDGLAKIIERIVDNKI